MNAKPHAHIHAALDRAADAAGTNAEPARELAAYRDALARLERARRPAPAGFERAVRSALPVPRPAARACAWWPERRLWAVPAFAGALAALAIVFGLRAVAPAPASARVTVHFQVHAPGAQQVDLLGDFNNWSPGTLRLQGPDASGHWIADVELPEGRYEYQFLVDGKTWVTDPNAPLRRPDGFGRENAVVHVYHERG